MNHHIDFHLWRLHPLPKGCLIIQEAWILIILYLLSLQTSINWSVLHWCSFDFCLISFNHNIPNLLGHRFYSFHSSLLQDIFSVIGLFYSQWGDYFLGYEFMCFSDEVVPEIYLHDIYPRVQPVHGSLSRVPKKCKIHHLFCLDTNLL